MDRLLTEIMKESGQKAGNTLFAQIKHPHFLTNSIVIKQGFFFLLVTNGTTAITDAFHRYTLSANQLLVLTPSTESVLSDASPDFSKVIRIPHGKMMKYVHQGYASLYEKELFLRFESGILVSYREEDNTHFYANKKRMEERNMSDLCEAIFGVKLQKKGNWLHNLFRHLHKLYRR